jgi:demethylmenaquinone methyltransferase/2-methoxy-6-polyprenyl-1,4-benzoquinol methylase
MSAASAGNPVPPAAVRSMFDRIAPVYDVMNTLMTAGLDARWRQAAIAAAWLGPGMRVLDAACGTGKLTRAAAARVAPGGEAIGIDLSEAMLRRATRAGRGRGTVRPRYLAADALALPFADGGPAGGFDAVTIGFGLRNLADYRAGLAEMRRVLAPGGRLVVLEIAEPRGGLPRLLYRTWFRRVVPLLGRLARRGSAYRYLPDSLRAYPPPEAVAGLMAEVGLTGVAWRYLPGGMATLHAGRAPEAATP